MTLTRHFSCSAALIGAAFAVLPATPASAQDDERDWIVTVGGGAQAFPKYPGADEVGIFPLPIIDLRREGDPLPFEAPDEGWGFGILGDDSAFNFGPALVFQNKRREEDVGAPVGNVGFTVEAGAFAELFVGRHFRLRAEGRRGLGGHDGWNGDISADLVVRDHDTYVFSIGPRARIADDNFHDAYFSVTPAVAAATGLPVYDAGGGIHALGVVAGAKYMLDRNWGLYGYAGYDRLIGDAADSPIVRAFGSRDQFSGGLGIFYSFNAGNLFGG
jgi:outer membrane protein